MLEKIEKFIEALEAKNASENTIRAYRSDLADLALFLRGSTEITRHDIRRYIATINTGKLERSSIARKLAAIKSLSHWLTNEGLIPDDVAQTVIAPRVPKPLPSWPSEEEMRKLLAEPVVGPLPERDKLILHLLYGAGIRVEELVGINLEDIQQPDVIRIRGKGKKERFVIFGECAQDALQAYLPIREKILSKKLRYNECPVNALLFGLRGAQYVERLDTRSVRRIIAAMARSKGLPIRNPHAFRHAFATHMLDNGASIVTVAKLLGHARLSTTERYTHVSAARMLRVYKTAHPHAVA